MNRILAMGSAFALAALFAAGAAAPVRADDWSKTYQISSRADLHVTTDDGDVNVTPSDQKQIDAKVTTVGYKIGPSDVRIEESQNGDHVTLAVRMPHMSWSFWGGSHNRSIHVELRVPRDLEIEVKTGDGNVTSQAVAGHIYFDTGDGNITATGLKGEIHLHSGDGHIEAGGLDGSLRVDTGDGHVNIRGRFDSLDVNTGDGSIEAEAASGSKVSSPWAIKTGDGHINLRIASDLKADLSAHTGDGSITLDFPITVSGSLSHSSVNGKLNGGGGELRLTSGDGSIHLEKL
jgi:Putative adhesin